MSSGTVFRDMRSFCKSGFPRTTTVSADTLRVRRRGPAPSPAIASPLPQKRARLAKTDVDDPQVVKAASKDKEECGEEGEESEEESKESEDEDEEESEEETAAAVKEEHDRSSRVEPAAEPAAAVEPAAAASGVMAEYSDTPLFVFDNPKCGRCRAPLDMQRCQISGKSQASWRCNKCNIKAVQASQHGLGNNINTIVGNLSDDQVAEFWQSVNATPSAHKLKELIDDRLEQSHAAGKIASEKGTYQPLKYYKKIGYDTKMIKEHCTDTREHPLLGRTYKVDLVGIERRREEWVKRSTTRRHVSRKASSPSATPDDPKDMETNRGKTGKSDKAGKKYKKEKNDTKKNKKDKHRGRSSKGKKRRSSSPTSSASSSSEDSAAKRKRQKEGQR